MKRIRFVHVTFAALVAALAVPAAGVSKGSAVPSSVGQGEGKLTMVVWEGYAEKQWVAPFELPAYSAETLQPLAFSNGATHCFSA